MLEKLLTELLNKYLSQYIEILDKSQLDITLRKGQIELENVKLKSTVFDGLSAPFNLAYGQVGSIKIRIPIWKLLRAPIEVEISDVFVLLRPKLMRDWREDIEKEDFKKKTQDQLDKFELKYESQEKLKKQNTTAMDKIKNILIDNIQVSIKSLYVRYEDSFTDTSGEEAIFSFGILLKEFSAFSTKEDWVSKGMVADKDMMKKVVSIDDFSLFLDYKTNAQTVGINKDFRFDIESCRDDPTGNLLKDFLDKEFERKKKENKLKLGQDLEKAAELNKNHNYLLDTFCFEARIAINKRPKKEKKPEFDINILLGGKFKYFEYPIHQTEEIKLSDVLLKRKADLTKIQFSLKTNQIMRILQVAQFMGYYNEYQKETLKELYDHNVTKDVGDQYMNLYIKWKCFNKRKSKDALAKELRKEMEEIENQYTFDKIIVMRQYALKMIENEQEKVKDVLDFNQKLELKKKQIGGWFLSKVEKEMNEQELENYRQELLEEMESSSENNQNDFTKEINDLDNELRVQSVCCITKEEQKQIDDLGDEYVRYIFSINIPQLNFSFFNEFEQAVFQGSIQKQFAYAEIGDEFQRLQFSIESLYLDDYWSGASGFPRLVDTQPFVDSDVFLTELQENKLFYKPKSKQALIARLDLGKKALGAPFKVQIETQKTLFAHFNPYFYAEIMRTLSSSAAGEEIDLTYYKETAIEQGLILMEKSREFLVRLQRGVFHHIQFDVDIQIHGPVLIVPMDVFDNNKPCLIIDSGIIKGKSYLLKNDKKINYKVIKDPKKLYDRYELSLECLQIAMLDHSIHKDLMVKKNPKKKSVIEEFNASLIFLNCLDPNHPKYPTFELVLSIPNIQLLICQSLVEKIMRLSNSLLDQWAAQDYAILQKVAKGENVVQIKETDEDVRKEKELMARLKKSIYQKIQQKKKNKAEEYDKMERLREIDQNLYLLQLEYELKKADVKIQMPTKYEAEEIKNILEEETKEDKREVNTNIKFFVQITKFQLDLMDDNRDFMNLEIGKANFVKIQMLNLEAEVEVDGVKNMTTKLCVYKFVIQDIQQDTNIQAQFRMILSDPGSLDEWRDYEQKIIEQLDPESDYKDFIIYQSNSKAYLQHSILYKLQHKKWKKRQEKLIEKHQIKNLLDLKKIEAKKFGKHEETDITNEFEFQFYKHEKEVFTKTAISNMRLILTMPTLQKLVKIQIGITELMEDLEELKYQNRFKYMHRFENVLQNIEDDFDTERDLYYQKVIKNFVQASQLKFEEFQEITQEAIEDVMKLWKQQKFELEKIVDIQKQNDYNNEDKLELASQDPTQQSPKKKKRHTKEKEFLTMKLFMVLTNFTIWLPMNSAEANTQIMGLSFHSEARLFSEMENENIYEKQTHMLMKKHVINQKDEFTFKVDEFTMQNLTVIPEEFQGRSCQKVLEQDRNHHHYSEKEYSKINMLKPVNVELNSTLVRKNLGKYSRSDSNIVMSPVKLSIGFKQIHFANILMVKVQKMISKQYQRKDHRQYLDESETYQEFMEIKEKEQDMYDKAGINYYNLEFEQKADDNAQMEEKRKDAQVSLQKTMEKDKKKGENAKEKIMIVGVNDVKEVRINNLDFICQGGITVQLIDEELNNQPLINCIIEDSYIKLRSYKQQEDAASFILKKMGIYQKNHTKEEIDETLALFAETTLKLDINYFNQRNLAFEPLIEPWSAQISARQEYSFTEKQLLLDSQYFFNINFTFGGAETLARIMGKIQLSLQEAGRQSKLLEDKELTADEKAEQEEFEETQKEILEMDINYNYRRSIKEKKKDKLKKKGQLGYEFKNFTGYPIKFAIHDDSLNKNLQQVVNIGEPYPVNYQIPSYELEPVIARYQNENDDDHPKRFITHEEAEQRQKDIKMKINKGRQVDTLEEEPLSIDLKIETGAEVLKNIEVETLGIYGYVGYIQKELTIVDKEVVNKETVPEEEQVIVDQTMLNKKQKKKDKGLFGLGLIKKKTLKETFGIGTYKDTEYEDLSKAINQVEGESKNVQRHSMGIQGDKKMVVQRFGIICNVQYNGQFKQVSIESQLLLFNNLNRDLTFFYKGLNQQQISAQQTFVLKKGESFRAPLTWFLADDPMQLYLEDEASLCGHMLFNDIHRIFSHNVKVSQLSSDHTKILFLDKKDYISLDIKSYACINQSKKHNPLQYVVAFNPPLIISNFNICPLVLSYSQATQEILASINPSVSTHITMINPVKENSLAWTFYEKDRSPLELITSNFELNSRMDQEFTEQFIPLEKTSYLDYVNIQMEFKRLLTKKIESYNKEKSFEFRKLVQDFQSSQEVILYPRFLIVNKNSWPIQCRQQVFQPFASQYLNVQKDKTKVRFSIPGYTKSSRFNIETTGLSGDIEVNIKDKGHQPVKLAQNYPSEKVEMGLYIKAANHPFKMTTIVTVAPRFVFTNMLKIPLVIKQVNQRSQVLLEPEKKYQVFNFEMKDTEQIQVREVFENEYENYQSGQGLFQSSVDNESLWSGSFQIEDLDDFTISFHSNSEKEENNWFEPSKRNGHLRFTRVIVTSKDDATINIVIGNPVQSDFLIQNLTDIPLQFVQIKSGKNLTKVQISKRQKVYDSDSIQKYGKVKRLQSGEIIPYTPFDLNESQKRILIRIDNSDQIIDMDKALRRKVIQGSSGKFYCLQLKISTHGKRLKVQESEDPHVLKKLQTKTAPYFNTLLKRRFNSIFSITLKMKGLGISIIDQEPKELFFFTIYGLEVNLKKQLEARKDVGLDVLEYLTYMKLYVDHVQLDNMFDSKLPVILAPRKELLRREFKIAEAYQENDSLEEAQNEQMPSENIRTMHSSRRSGSKNKYDLTEEDKQAEVKNTDNKEESQEFSPFLQVIVGYSQGIPEKDKFTLKEDRISSIQVSLQQFQVQIDTKIIDKVLKYVDQVVGTFNKSGDKEKKDRLQYFERMREKMGECREIYCPELKPDELDSVDPSKVQNSKWYIEYMNLGPLKALISFMYQKDQLTFDVNDPNKRFGGQNMLNGVITSVSSISNSSLRFKQLIIMDTYTTIEMLIQRLQKSYTRQAILQFYKLLGASDLIGNPLGLVDKLGTGVFELFSEPVEGALNGPEDFVSGVGKGVQSFVTNIVSGSFESVSKISGSLYTLVKAATGETGITLKRPDHIWEGITLGVKGGAKEIANGVTGVVKKPAEGSKEKGVGGTIKGVGQGVLGLVAAPITATLRFGSAVTQGISSSADKMGNAGKMVQSGTYARFRPPRYINTKAIIKPYNEEFSIVHFLINDIHNGAYSRDTLKYFCFLPETTMIGELVGDIEDPYTILILTNKHIFYIKFASKGRYKAMSKLLFKKQLPKVKIIKIFEGYENEYSRQTKKHISKFKIFKKLRQRRLKKKETKVEKSLEDVEDDFYCLCVRYKKNAKREEKKKYKFVSLKYFDFHKIAEIASLNPQVKIIDEVEEEQEHMFDENQGQIDNPEQQNVMQQPVLIQVKEETYKQDKRNQKYIYEGMEYMNQ